MSQDVYANPTTVLSVIGSGGGGGTAPGNVPFPVAGTVTDTTIEITFDVSSVTGTQPITYEALISDSPGGFSQSVPLNPPVGNVYTGTATGLTPNTTYYFKVRATNAVSFTESAEQPIPTGAAPNTPPGNVPNLEFLEANSTFIRVFLDAAAVTGSLPIVYSARYASTADSWNASAVLSLSTGTIYAATAQNLEPGTNYYFQTEAVNSGGTTSTIAPYPLFSTLIYAPAGASRPGAPQPSLANNGGLISTLYFDVAGQTGTPPVTYDMLWNIDGNAFFSTTVNLSSGTIYTGVINDLPTNPGTYQIYSRASNAGGAIISDNTAVVGATIASPITVTPSTMNIGAIGIGPTIISLSTTKVLNGNPQPEIVAQFGTVSSSLISTTGNFSLIANPMAISTIFDLPSSTTFYFNTVAYNVFASTVNTEIVAISTLS
jgi:hypothetical protein